MPRIEKFDEEVPSAEYGQIQRIRRRNAGCGCLIILLLAGAVVAWFVLKGPPWRRAAARALPENEEEYWRKDGFVPGIDYDTGRAREDDDE